ncbi:ATP-binding protein [Vulcanisaeta sp. JCM 14467]|uniref:ATP-binding protein n=1 Tax=Vulcanisaeta sp. JCM 14467 TaxID=1295370 RepID=UPI0006CFF625|nr:ATP-binding protein [Vulcanisaeta sp. JCM 14467]
MVTSLIDAMRSMDVDFGVIAGNPIRVGFRDREGEASELLRAFRFDGVRIIYGPLGCGKSTLLNILGRSINHLRETEPNATIRIGETNVSVEDVFYLYINYEKYSVELTAPYLTTDRRSRVLNALMELIDSIAVGSGIASISGIYDLLNKLVTEFSMDLSNKWVFIIHDEVDKAYATLVNRAGVGNDYGGLEGVVASYAGLFENFRDELYSRSGARHVVVVFSMSDQAAVKVTGKLRGKGLLTQYLLWNLPRESFIDVVNELMTKVPPNTPVDHELLWKLLGGNLRALTALAIVYSWDVSKWLGAEVINGLVNGLIRQLIGHGRAYEDEEQFIHSLRRVSAEPDAVEGIINAGNAAYRSNVLIEISGQSISQLPREPWIGRYVAYQLPAYYWALRSMASRGSINVEPIDVIREIG